MLRAKPVLNWTEKNLAPKLTRISKTALSSLTQCKHSFIWGLRKTPNHCPILSLAFVAWAGDLPDASPTCPRVTADWLWPCYLRAWWQPLLGSREWNAVIMENYRLTEPWGWPDASHAQSPHFDFILSPTEWWLWVSSTGQIQSPYTDCCAF